MFFLSFLGVELSVATSTRLKTALYSFTSPGGPLYPTRPVRHAAWETLDYLFPVGLLSSDYITSPLRPVQIPSNQIVYEVKF